MEALKSHPNQPNQQLVTQLRKIRWLSVNNDYQVPSNQLKISVRVQDLLLQSLSQYSYRFGVVAEPYYVPARDIWIGGQDGKHGGISVQGSLVKSEDTMISPLHVNQIHSSPNNIFMKTLLVQQTSLEIRGVNVQSVVLCFGAPPGQYQ
ncbi:Reverse transcriptase [Danaus plexippus plexippus]|uniref:Reverse transcriptase n=1 Tax=Danaus plexippus plexippus TaxID=278856 RepID=A0A212EV36_DANPL|nr:Reverse transcriptase [Danaus plexippus plexippus]